MDNEDVWQAAAAEVSNTINNFSNQLANERLARENREFQRDTSFQMWNMQNAYNDPAAAMERLRKAGINPFVAAASVANVNHAGEMSAPNQQAIAAQPFLPAGSGFYQMASALAQLANAKNKDKETEYLEKDMSNRLKLSMANADSAAFNLELDRAYKAAERDSGLQKLLADTKKAYQDIDLAIKQGTLADMQSALTSAQVVLTNLQSNEQRLRNDVLPQMLLNQINLLQEQIKTEQSKQAQNYASAHEALAAADSFEASASYTRAQQKTEDVLRDFRKMGAILDNGLKAAQNKREFERVKYAALDALNEMLKNGYAAQSEAAEVKKKILELQYNTSILHSLPLGQLFSTLK